MSIKPYYEDKWVTIYHGDCHEILPQLDVKVDLVICDAPYGVSNKDWDKIGNVQDYNLDLIKVLSGILQDGGTLYLFGKPNCIDFIDYRPYLILNSRIVWYQPSRLSQGKVSYTNNYDVIVYLTKGKAKTFNLDAIRVPQLVELEHRKRCENVPSVKSGKFGKTKFNPDGKNPGDVWGDIKQLTYKSEELLDRELLHTIQKPQKLFDRIIKASSNEDDVILDPFLGSGTTVYCAKKLNRRCIGIEIVERYCEMAAKRCCQGAMELG